jgi:RIO-like serine/threonine protein kinase
MAILREIHEAGVLHCDLCPQNLLLDEFGGAAIVDFDQSERHPSKAKMKRECPELARILDSLGEE